MIAPVIPDSSSTVKRHSILPHCMIRICQHGHLGSNTNAVICTKGCSSWHQPIPPSTTGIIGSSSSHEDDLHSFHQPYPCGSEEQRSSLFSHPGEAGLDYKYITSIHLPLIARLFLFAKSEKVFPDFSFIFR
ncbi:MAG: hypothetical protein MZV64_18500 [Ignavibacteriales bacterium]|nr:hypothetical protein [Ignavibacteriales bacterium]